MSAVARASSIWKPVPTRSFPRRLTPLEMFRAFAIRMPGVPLPANMTEFDKTPFFTAAEFEQMGYKMVIWPVPALQMANKAQQKLYAALARDGGTQNVVDQMQTRAEVYAIIGLHDYEALDASIVQTIFPEGMPQREQS
jgi:methylisocitrate lyase